MKRGAVQRQRMRGVLRIKQIQHRKTAHARAPARRRCLSMSPCTSARCVCPAVGSRTVPAVNSAHCRLRMVIDPRAQPIFRARLWYSIKPAIVPIFKLCSRANSFNLATRHFAIGLHDFVKSPPPRSIRQACQITTTRLKRSARTSIAAVARAQRENMSWLHDIASCQTARPPPLQSCAAVEAEIPRSRLARLNRHREIAPYCAVPYADHHRQTERIAALFGQTRTHLPRASATMKLIAAGVTKSAASTRSALVVFSIFGYRPAPPCDRRQLEGRMDFGTAMACEARCDRGMESEWNDVYLC